MSTILADRIAAVAGNVSVELGPLLGRVLAHEIGHLLLGTTAHGEKD